MLELYNLDCRDALNFYVKTGSVQTCVTSPPYFGLRSYAENLVQIDPRLSPEKREWLMAELARRGVHARG
jgi:hypothetical protein